MRFLNRVWLALLLILPIFSAPRGWAQTNGQANTQTKTQSTPHKAAPSFATDAQRKNMQEYINLLRQNVRQQKAEIMGSMMLLSASDAAKFWPIYEQYDSELTKLNDQRVENIKEYARAYDQMTDEKADELIQKALTYQKQRTELFANTYDKVKQAIGAVTAARFAQIESQLLLLIDLQIQSSLPIVGQSS
jgi:hypothetical protein